jgi:16S rRNA (uracil1498-N3)-methyltransferase
VSSGRFFIDAEHIRGDTACLTGDEHYHLSQVLRKKRGERIILFDAEGHTFKARITKVGPEKTHVAILDVTQGRKGLQIGLGQCLLKSHKMEWIIQKGTELGLTDLFPLQSARSIVRPEAGREKKMARWRRIALEAVKQSGRPDIPQIHEPLSLEGFLDREPVQEEECLFLSESGGDPLNGIIRRSEDRRRPRSVILLCGPEGGWTKEEEKNILGSGFHAVSLGSYILRAETAALSAMAIVSHFWSRST